ncbi:PKD domain-containing protein [Edaphobacter bradus]|uniref:PKD domain-containing protein n=1 Tax=Edaphobacter bradus TaxID=2259016 RepID=UPI0021DFD5C6|nr:PKD domain-containing protein [Edaphobacter bradus]
MQRGAFSVRGLLPFVAASLRLVAMAALLPQEIAAQALPAEISTTHFLITVNGQPVDVAHAAANYYFVNFDVAKSTQISITAETDDYWARGVEVQPWRLGIRPARKGKTITFRLDHPAKLSITRPGDYLDGAEMLFLFANKPETNPPAAAAPGLRYYGPGLHHENIDAKSGDNIYLAPGAVILGSLNLWGVENVRVFGRGIILYDGPQKPDDDDGWIHLPNWHAIVMDNAHHISIEGITCVVRSRTWMIQMKDSRDILFDNVKVVGGSTSNANQDGMDWLGGGDTIVSDSFFRAADDVFAMQGNWEGYSPEAMSIPGHLVSNILIEDSVLSTSISNVVRAAWPHKSFESHTFEMRNTDVLHMGLGGCGVPFALLEIWADPGGTGHPSGFTFNNIRMDDWYSLVQLHQPSPSISDVYLRDIFALESPSLVPSVFKGSVSGVTFDNVTLANKLVEKAEDVPLELESGASAPTFNKVKGPHAAFIYSRGLIAPHRAVHFDASTSRAGDAKIVSYLWSFGDGTHARGRSVKHAFPDDEGTLLDRSGRFRVLLETIDENGRVSWAYEPIVVADSLQHAAAVVKTEPGLSYSYFEGAQLTLANLVQKSEVYLGFSDQLSTTMRHRAGDYGLVFEGFLDVPADGGYTFTLLSNDAGSIKIDSAPVATSPAPWPQVCGSEGNAVQPTKGSIALRAGKHRIHVAMTHSTGEDGFAVLWQGPGIELAPIPATALSHSAIR